MCATRLYDNLFAMSKKGAVEIAGNGKTVFNVGGGNHRIVTVTDKLKIREEINRIFKESRL